MEVLVLLLAREISIGGCLFLLFFLVLFVVFNVPIQNILGKIFKENRKITTIIEVCFFLYFARLLAHWTEPLVNKFMDELTKYIVDLLVAIFAF